MKKIIISVLVSAVLVFFAVKDIKFDEIYRGARDFRYVFLAPAVLCFLAVLVLRSVRLGVIVSPIVRLSGKSLLGITSVGFMSIILFPLRMGEFVRPYLISVDGKVPFSSTLAVIFIERVFDCLVLISLLFLVLMQTTFFPWLKRPTYMFVAVFAVLIVFVLLVCFEPDRIFGAIRFFSRRLPGKIKVFIENNIRHFMDGFTIIKDPWKLLTTFFLSVLIWMFSGFAIYFLFLAHNLSLSIFAAFFVLLISMFGISVPSAPGFLGTFQYSCIVALAVYHISKTDALTFSISYYVIGIGIYLVAGVIFLLSDTRYVYSLKEVIYTMTFLKKKQGLTAKLDQ